MVCVNSHNRMRVGSVNLKDKAKDSVACPIGTKIGGDMRPAGALSHFIQSSHNEGSHE